MPALKVAFFTCFGFPQGTYFRWHNLAIGLRQLGHQVTVHAIGPAHLGRTQFEVRDGVQYVLVPVTPLIHRLLDFRLDPVTLLRAIRRAPAAADVFHVFQPFPHSCLPGLFHRANARCVIFDWDDLWWGGFYPERGGFLRRSAWVPRAVRFFEEGMPRRVDGVTTCSSFLAERALKNGAASVQVIHNGYWPGQTLPSKKAAREELGLDPEALYFGFMGRTVAEIDWCLDALAARRPLGRGVRLALCGMPPSMVEAFPAGLRASIDCLGHLIPEQTRVFARALDCGLLPLEDTPFNQSRFPIKFAEYMAGGAHVVASAVGEFARIASRLPGVTLAGTTRDAWRNTLASTDWEKVDTSFSVEPGSMLAQTLGWQAQARQLQDFYIARLDEKTGLRPDSSHSHVLGTAPVARI